MRRLSFAWFVAGVCLLTWGTLAFPASGAEPDAASMRGLWTLPGKSSPSGAITITLQPVEVFDTDDIALECQIHTRRRLKNVVVSLQILDAAQQVLSEGEAIIQAQEGSTSCLFRWNTADAPLGTYQAVFETRHSVPEPPARLEIPLRKVTGTQLLNELETLAQRIEELRPYAGIPDDDSPVVNPLQARLNIALDTIHKARGAAERQSWRELDAGLHYVRRSAETIGARLVFADAAPELLESVSYQDFGLMAVAPGAFAIADDPVYLFGAYLPQRSPEDLRRLRRYGFNFAAFPITPADTLSGPEQRAGFAAAFTQLFAAAEACNIGLAARLEPCLLGEWAHEQWPGLMDKGFVDWTIPGVRQTIERHYEAALPFLAAQRMVKAVSLADNPRFKFSSESVRLAFLERVRARYPDRPTLNQAWHSHLADFDEVTIWDEKAKPHEYQNRRAYQYEWQDFHRGLGLEYLQGLLHLARRLAPEMAMQFDLSSEPFEPGESRMGIDREVVARLGDVLGCEATQYPDDPHYGIRYPGPAVLYALMHSFQPHKPVLNMESGLVLPDEISPDALRAYIPSALWESVISGMNGMALPIDSPVFEIPEALESYAETALHVNRLAPIVRAFQQAPTDIAILFSDASKIMDDGEPHLQSARYAYEGCSFSGYNARFVTERQLIESGMGDARVLVLPATPAVTSQAFEALAAYVENDGVVARVGPPIPYDERGVSRHNVLRNTSKTVLVRGMNLPTEYLHAMDAAIALGALPVIPRLINPHGYPIEGVRSRHVVLDGAHYLYALNLRKDPVVCDLLGPVYSGRDLIQGRDIRFPMTLQPLDPMLIRLDEAPSLEIVAKAPEKERFRFSKWLKSNITAE